MFHRIIADNLAHQIRSHLADQPTLTVAARDAPDAALVEVRDPDWARLTLTVDDRGIDLPGAQSICPRPTVTVTPTGPGRWQCQLLLPEVFLAELRRALDLLGEEIAEQRAAPVFEAIARGIAEELNSVLARRRATYETSVRWHGELLPDGRMGGAWFVYVDRPVGPGKAENVWCCKLTPEAAEVADPGRRPGGPHLRRLEYCDPDLFGRLGGLVKHALDLDRARLRRSS